MHLCPIPRPLCVHTLDVYVDVVYLYIELYIYLYIQVVIYMYRHIQKYMDKVCVYIYSIYIVTYIYRLCRNVYTKWQQKPTYIYIFILYL
jgi:hypothetical protein